MATRKWDRSSRARSLLNKPDDLAAFGLPLIVNCSILKRIILKPQPSYPALRNGTEKRLRVFALGYVLYCIIVDFHFLPPGTEGRKKPCESEQIKNIKNQERINHPLLPVK